MYLNIFIVYMYGIFQCIYNIFQCISMHLNVFINIVIGISPPYSHCNVFTMHTHVDIYFLQYTVITFLICYTTIFFSAIPIDYFQLSYNL
jgi:hypothetical protein